MKSKLNPVFIILILFIFKVAVIDQFRFKHTDSNDKRLAHMEHSKLVVR